jgi:16S rRNA (cytosine967-C5)-methyltransferase
MLNLQQRFKNALIKTYKQFTADIGKEEIKNKAGSYDIIICDVPCTGSGTWGRTPDQLCFFNKKSIALYADKQRKIVTNVIPHLQNEGLFFYITCSVFKRENEEQVKFIEENFGLHLMVMKLLKGYDKKADTMFVAVFKK